MTFGLHTINSLSIRQYGIIDQTNNVSLLRRSWNVFPVGWFDTTKVINDIIKIVNSNVDYEIADEVGKIMRYNRIILLEALHIGIYNLIVLKPENDQWNITKKNRTNLISYINQVKSLTGIEIKDLTGLKKLNKETERLSDKYVEFYKGDEKPKGKAISFLRFAYSIFGIMEESYNPEMKMNEFGELIISATEKAEYLESLKRKDGK